MAKFTNKDLRLKDEQRVTWGTDLDANMWYDGTADQLRVDVTISGVDPTQDYHLTTKYYVDNEIATLSGSIAFDHGDLTGLDDDDHSLYVPTNGSRGFTSTVSGIDPIQDFHLATKWYIDNELATVSGGIVQVHANLTGLDADDHDQYSLVTGARAFTGTVGGITPTLDSHLTTKQYVDALVQGLTWLDPVINIVPVASGIASEGNRYIASETGGGWTEDYIYEYTGASWSGTAPVDGSATWVEELDYLTVYNGTDWVRFGSTVLHNNLGGLQGGTADEYYHMTSAQYTDLTDVGGADNASTQHIHDDRYYTESEIDSTVSGLSPTGHQHPSTDVTDFTEAAQDAVGNIMVGAGNVTVGYDDGTPQITISGSEPILDHGGLTGLEDDDHPQYILVDGSRGFTATVSGIDPTQDYHLATKSYVDDGGIDHHGRQAIANGASTVSVTFADLGHTNYTVNATMENTSDSPPSIYAFIVSAKTSTGFTCTLMGDTDSANYILNWSVIED